MKAKLVHVVFGRLNSGLIFGESVQVPGLHMSARTMEEFEEKTPIVLQALLRERGQDVAVIPADAYASDTLTYVVIARNVLETLLAIHEAEAGETKSFDSVPELMEDLNRDDETSPAPAKSGTKA